MPDSAQGVGVSDDITRDMAEGKSASFSAKDEKVKANKKNKEKKKAM